MSNLNWEKANAAQRVWREGAQPANSLDDDKSKPRRRRLRTDNQGRVLIKAKFPSLCAKCKNKVAVDNQIWWDKPSGRVWHRKCANNQKERA